MQKIVLLCICFWGITGASPAQQIWYKTLPYGAQNASFSSLTTDGSHYFVHSNRGYSELDLSGDVTGHFAISNSPFFWTSVIKRYTTPGGKPYFLVARRPIASGSGYILNEYRPGAGLLNELTCIDSLGAFSGSRPLILDLPDGSLLVVGRQYYRKMKFTQATGFSEEWVRPFNMPASAVLIQGNRLIAADLSGNIVAFDDNGNPLWAQQHPLKIRSIAAVPGGFIACGQSALNKAAVLKTDHLGALIWIKETDDTDYQAIISTKNGGFAVTGQSDTAGIMLAHLNTEGEQIWKNEFGKGHGLRLLQEQDGGFVVLSQQSSGAFNLSVIKTDSQGQTVEPDAALIDGRRLSNGSIRATFFASPSLFNDSQESVFSSAPEGAALLFAFAPWLGGYNESNDLCLTAADYLQTSRTDYGQGPIGSAAGDFRRVWFAGREEINRLRQDFALDQQLDQPVSFDLLTWPGKGNPHWRYNLNFTPVETNPLLFPAPFEDINGDGIYNVYDGDLPIIQGDQMVWWVLNDDTVHTRSNGNKIGFDLHISAYAYDCPQNGAIEQSLFTEFKFINRSPANYHDVHMGFFANPNLGCFEDDYFGSMPEENACYVYNADEFDGSCFDNFPGFGYDIPVQSVALINQSLDHFIYFNNPAEGNPHPATTDPALPEEFYHYLKGEWRDGIRPTKGGSGYNPLSSDFADYTFSDNPVDPQGWSFCTANQPYYDRRMISTHGPFDFAAGDTFHIQVAFTLHPSIPHPCPDISAHVKPVVARINQWKNNGTLDARVDLDPVVSLPPGQSVTLDANLSGALGYLWSTGAATSDVTVSQPGSYTVTVTASTGCQMVEHVVVQLGTGINVPPATQFWTLHPNPAKDFTVIDCPGCTDDGLQQAVLRNAQGAGLVHFSNLNRRARLNLQGLPPGFYWLELWQNGAFAGAKKLVLAK